MSGCFQSSLESIMTNFIMNICETEIVFECIYAITPKYKSKSVHNLVNLCFAYR